MLVPTLMLCMVGTAESLLINLVINLNQCPQPFWNIMTYVKNKSEQLGCSTTHSSLVKTFVWRVKGHN